MRIEVQMETNDVKYHSGKLGCFFFFFFKIIWCNIIYEEPWMPVEPSAKRSCLLWNSCCSRSTHCSEMWPELQSKKRPSWVRTQRQGAGRACSAEFRELCKQQGQVLRKRGKDREKKKKKGWELVTFCGSNHGGEGKSRPLRRQPVREQWEGVQTAQAVLFIKHTPPN